MGIRSQICPLNLNPISRKSDPQFRKSDPQFVNLTPNSITRYLSRAKGAIHLSLGHRPRFRVPPERKGLKARSIVLSKSTQDRIVRAFSP